MRSLVPIAVDHGTNRAPQLDWCSWQSRFSPYRFRPTAMHKIQKWNWYLLPMKLLSVHARLQHFLFADELELLNNDREWIPCKFVQVIRKLISRTEIDVKLCNGCLPKLTPYIGTIDRLTQMPRIIKSSHIDECFDLAFHFNSGTIQMWSEHHCRQISITCGQT